MDLTAFYKLTYGLYIVSSNAEGLDAGCIVNTVTQVTAEPPKVSVAVNKDNTTAKVIQKAGAFAVTALTQSADSKLIGTFGFRSSQEEDKFQNFHTERDQAGMPYVTDWAAARFSCKVIQTVDLGTHWLFIGEATEAEKLLPEEPMTYTYYQNNVKPKPDTEGKKGFVCKVCGYVYEGDELPDDFICPLCKHGAADFEPIQ